MKVAITDIPAEGKDLSFSDAAAEPQDLGPQVEAVVTAPSAQLRLERVGELVTAKGTYAAELVLACSRCLGPVPLSLAGELDWAFRPLGQEDREEVQLAEDELEVSFYEDGQVDLAQALRDELGLALPMAPLCREDCTGLCPVCGKPVKPGEPCCRRNEVDPRWARLAQLKK
ncbi:MAG: DUF177 domain-containing protein [Proteobacteria bacterium]|nr:DUF177 domain-containing protein [Pseudomonadota bacterium]MBU4275722.1 DUF177 domain-containing protein [Pseudomonadota bacterium]MBU4383757.1 DUF177 domain-containing protein [Pseudomonadota bacterium]MBU4603466.1 DUF177 domain-containing protein [Pseudomonadota bacterium]MCG2763399.1 YceD family protein [Desulfarculaceae bacterium]